MVSTRLYFFFFFFQLLGTSSKKVWNYKLSAFASEIMQVKHPQDHHIARAVLLRYYKDTLDRGDQFWYLVSKELSEFYKLTDNDRRMYAS